MKLYHGSNLVIEQIDLYQSKPCKDFGRGFYLSDDPVQAEELASFRALTLGGSPVVTTFEFDESLLTDGSLKYLQFEHYSEEWARFVFENRKNAFTFDNSFDVIYGPIANDRVGLQIQKLEDGSIDMAEFLHRIRYFKGVTYQYLFGTELAISKLKKV